MGRHSVPYAFLSTRTRHFFLLSPSGFTSDVCRSRNKSILGCQQISFRVHDTVSVSISLIQHAFETLCSSQFKFVHSKNVYFFQGKETARTVGKSMNGNRVADGPKSLVAAVRRRMELLGKVVDGLFNALDSVRRHVVGHTGTDAPSEEDERQPAAKGTKKKRRIRQESKRGGEAAESATSEGRVARRTTEGGAG